MTMYSKLREDTHNKLHDWVVLVSGWHSRSVWLASKYIESAPDPGIYTIPTQSPGCGFTAYLQLQNTHNYCICTVVTEQCQWASVPLSSEFSLGKRAAWIAIVEALRARTAKWPLEHLKGHTWYVTRFRGFSDLIFVYLFSR